MRQKEKQQNQVSPLWHLQVWHLPQPTARAHLLPLSSWESSSSSCWACLLQELWMLYKTKRPKKLFLFPLKTCKNTTPNLIYFFKMSTVALVWAAILLHHAVTKNQNRRKFYTSSSEGLNQTPFSQLPLLSPYVSVLFLPILFKDLYKQYGICFRYMFNISNGKVIWECFVYHLINQPFSWSLRQQPWYPKLSNGLFAFSGDDNVLSKAPGMVPNWTVRQTLNIACRQENL